MTYLHEAKTLEELKKLYKKYAMMFHPDSPSGDLEKMQALNNEYDKLFKTLKNIHTNKEGEFYEKETDETPEAFKDLINKLLSLNGLNIEIIGSFVWVGGNTKEHKDELKKLGFRWHSQKELWYFCPYGYKKQSKKVYTMDELRSWYGSETIKEQEKISKAN